MAKIKIKYLIIALAILFVIQAGLLFVWWKISAGNQLIEGRDFIVVPWNDINVDYSVLPSHRSYSMIKEFYDEAFEEANGQKVIADNKIFGGIIPHHLLVKDKIAAYFLGLKKNDYDTIILIGPNHFEAGPKNILVSKARWETPYGDLLPHVRIVEELEKMKDIEIYEDAFAAEHSISGLVPFIKFTYPDAHIVPIILKSKTTKAEAENLADILSAELNEGKTLVLASVDFSHYLPAAVADFHDSLTNSVIKSFDYDRIYNLEIDSPASIYTLLKYLENTDAKNGELIFSTNSSRLIGSEDEPGTSHGFYYFYYGETEAAKKISLLFFGDMMLDRNVGGHIKKKGLDYIFEKLKGEENRFFRGVDLISANLEGAVTNGGAHYPPVIENDFAFAPELVAQLKDYNFNFFNIANNHLSDQGIRGIDETTQNLKSLGFHFSGCADGLANTTCSTTIINVADKKLGFAGFSMVYSKFDIAEAEKIVKELASTTEMVVVNIHWGVEYSHQFNKTQQEVAYSLIDAGADVIIGHHPHVVQGVEEYKGAQIFYSLGNFIFDQYFSEATKQGLAVGLTVDFSEENPKYDYHLFPLQSENSQVELMSGENKENFLTLIKNWSEN